MNTRKLKITAGLVAIATTVLLGGCSRDDWGVLPPEEKINSMARPVKILANNSEGLTVQGADGEIAHWRSSYYFAATIRESDLKAGDVIVP